MQTAPTESDRGILPEKIASKVKAKVRDRASMLCVETQAAVEDRLLSVLELLTDKGRCELGCITSSVDNTRCMTCYRDVG